MDFIVKLITEKGTFEISLETKINKLNSQASKNICIISL